MGELVWTNDPPTEPGFYWHRIPGSEPEVVKVEEHLGHMWLAECGAAFYNISSFEYDAQWAGPVKKPKED